MLFLTLCLLAVLCVVVTYALRGRPRPRGAGSQDPPGRFRARRDAHPVLADDQREDRRHGVPTCEVAEKPLTEKLKRIEADLAEARDERRDALQVRDEAREGLRVLRTTSIDSDEGKEAQAAIARVGEADQKIAELKEQQVLTLKLLGRDATQDEGHARPVGHPDDPRATPVAGTPPA
jgi:hypothetical protein